jgi:hypothetical protein
MNPDHADHLAAMAYELETVAGWMTANSYATGQGDSIEDLLGELAWQIKEQRERAKQEAAVLRAAIEQFLAAYPWGPDMPELAGLRAALEGKP